MLFKNWDILLYNLLSRSAYRSFWYFPYWNVWKHLPKALTLFLFRQLMSDAMSFWGVESWAVIRKLGIIFDSFQIFRCYVNDKTFLKFKSRKAMCGPKLHHETIFWIYMDVFNIFSNYEGDHKRGHMKDFDYFSW